MLAGGRDIPLDWPFAPEDWKPKDRKRDLVRATALLIAELDRMIVDTDPAASEEKGATT